MRSALSSPHEVSALLGRVIAAGYHSTSRTASFFTRVPGVDGTERNWRTILALSHLTRE